MKLVTSSELVQLLKDAGLIEAVGSINMELLGTKVRVNDKNAVGNLLQEWLSDWMKNNQIYFRTNPNTQVFPDFYLGKFDDRELLEVKSFDYTKSPNFDVANFDAYIRSLESYPYRLDAEYLIFGYTLNMGKICINNIWLKHIWEITCPSNEYALRTQNKQGKITNIRPYNFKNNSVGFLPFNTKIDFVIAIKDTIAKYISPERSSEWFTNVTNTYERIMGKSL